MKKVASVLFALLVVSAIIYFALDRKVLVPSGGDVDVQQYTSSDYGVSFNYPSNYFLEEKNVESTSGNHQIVVLTEDTEENKDIREGNSPGREGPTSIMLSVYTNPDSKPLDAFIKDSADLSYQFADRKVSTTSISALETYESTWSGLYEGKSYLVSRGQFVYTVSVTWLDPSDKILTDFADMVRTLVIQ